VILDTPAITATRPGRGATLVVVHGYVAQMQTGPATGARRGKAVLADVEDVFDEFNGGVFHACAIQRFRATLRERDASALVRSATRAKTRNGST
jgi:hypothetical protein